MVDWSEVDYIGPDNNSPAQLWAWSAEKGHIEAAEPLFRIDGWELAAMLRRQDY